MARTWTYEEDWAWIDLPVFCTALLRAACGTLLRTRPEVVVGVSVTYSLRGVLLEAASLQRYTDDLAQEYDLRSCLIDYHPPVFTVRFTRPDSVNNGAAALPDQFAALNDAKTVRIEEGIGQPPGRSTGW